MLTISRLAPAVMAVVQLGGLVVVAVIVLILDAGSGQLLIQSGADGGDVRIGKGVIEDTHVQVAGSGGIVCCGRVVGLGIISAAGD